MPLTDNTTPGSPTQDEDDDGGLLGYVETFATIGGALILAVTLWHWWKTGKAPI